MSNKSRASFLISKSRERRKKRDKKLKKFQPWAYLAAIILSLSAVIFVFWGVDSYSNSVRDLPSIDLLPLIIEPETGSELMPTRIFDREGEVLLYSHQNPNAAGSQYISFDQIPEDLINSIVISIDPDYWKSSFLSFILKSELSAITSELISIFLFENSSNPNPSPFVQTLISSQVERKFGKEKILEWYLNTIDFGNLASGIDRASRVYFGKSVIDLELAEISMLTAIAKSPGINPIDSLTLAKQNQEKVLQDLVANGSINSVQAKKALNAELGLLPKQEPIISISGNFIHYLLDQLSYKIGETQLAYGGNDVISTLDYDLQLAVECTADLQVSRISGEIAPNFLSDPDCDAGRLLPPLGINELSSSVNIEASIIILDSKSGEILAFWGNPQELHQPGIVISPFIYLTAFTRGYSPASLIWDIPSNTPSGVDDFITDKIEYQGPVRLRTALANDLITPALHTLSQIGVENVWFTANNSGITALQFSSGTNPFNSLFTDNTVHLLEITHSFSMFSNNGKIAGVENQKEYITTPVPSSFNEIFSSNPIIEGNHKISSVIVSPEYSYLITDILSDPASRLLSWDAGNPLELGFASSVITSSNFDDEQHWIIGYSSDIVVGVWIGNDVEVPSPTKISKIVAAGLWHALMRYAHIEAPPDDFYRPPGIINIEVCDPSGMLPTNTCPTIVSEVFIDGSEPRYPDTLFKSIQINEQTGLLATVTTPPELIIEKVFMDIPEAALSWAFDADLDIPPSSYDIVYQGSNQNPNVTIDSPGNFSYLNGLVQIAGNAKGANFDSFKLEYGKGIAPLLWQQIGDTNQETVSDSLLATWDTSNLEGLYALRLQAIYSDYTIVSDVIQITVDNQSPHLKITYPEEAEIFFLETDPNIPIHISVNDNISIDHVDFYVNNTLLISLTEQPFTASWDARKGEFTIKIIAYDDAGNSTESEILISIK